MRLSPPDCLLVTSRFPPDSLPIASDCLPIASRLPPHRPLIASRIAFRSPPDAALIRCALSFAVGLLVTYELRTSKGEQGAFTSQPAADAFMRCTSHTRLLWGAADMAIILLGIALVDAVPSRRAAWVRATPMYKRLGEMSLTMYAWGDLIGRFCYIPFARYARRSAPNARQPVALMSFVNAHRCSSVPSVLISASCGASRVHTGTPHAPRSC